MYYGTFNRNIARPAPACGHPSAGGESKVFGLAIPSYGGVPERRGGFRSWHLILLLLCTSGAGFSQAVHCGVGVTDMHCPYCRYDHYGYPCEHRYTVSVLDYPLVEKPKKLEPVKPHPVDDPIQARLEKRMAEIDSAGFANTNKTRIEIVPGLTPKN